MTPSSTTPSSTTPSEREAMVFHGLFLLIAGSGLAALHVQGTAPATLGAAMLGLTAAYHLALVAIGRWRDHDDWLELWLFVLPLSLLQVLPDAFLAAVLGVLEFPLPGPRIGPVSAFMAGLWAPALLLVVLAGEAAARRRGDGAGALAALAASTALFVGSEALLTRLPVWRALDVATVGPVALYVVAPELLLGLTTWAAYRHRAVWQGAGAALLWRRLGAAALLSTLYLGALAASYLVVEVFLRGGGDASRL